MYVFLPSLPCVLCVFSMYVWCVCVCVCVCVKYAISLGLLVVCEMAGGIAAAVAKGEV